MGFWIFMVVMDLIIPLTMILFGRAFLNNPPKAVNRLYGYRTKSSMKNEDTWLFAQQYCGNVWHRTGWLLLLPVAAVMPLVIKGENDTVGVVGGMLCLLQGICLVLSILPTERALKAAFDEAGRRRL